MGAYIVLCKFNCFLSSYTYTYDICPHTPRNYFFCRLDLGILFLPLSEVELGGHFMTFICSHFSSEVIVRLTRRVRRHFVTPIEVGVNPIEYNPGYAKEIS